MFKALESSLKVAYACTAMSLLTIVVSVSSFDIDIVNQEAWPALLLPCVISGIDSAITSTRAEYRKECEAIDTNQVTKQHHDIWQFT
jgi:hypothetical protein